MPVSHKAWTMNVNIDVSRFFFTGGDLNYTLAWKNSCWRLCSRSWFTPRGKPLIDIMHIWLYLILCVGRARGITCAWFSCDVTYPWIGDVDKKHNFSCLTGYSSSLSRANVSIGKFIWWSTTFDTFSNRWRHHADWHLFCFPWNLYAQQLSYDKF